MKTCYPGHTDWNTTKRYGKSIEIIGCFIGTINVYYAKDLTKMNILAYYVYFRT